MSSAVVTATALEGMADADLVVRARHGDIRATGLLVSRYRGAVRARASNYFLVGGDRDDVGQEGMIGLNKAMRDFDPGNGASFRSFADLCITRQILTAIKTATRQTHAAQQLRLLRPSPGRRGRSHAGRHRRWRSQLDPLECLWPRSACAP